MKLQKYTAAFLKFVGKITSFEPTTPCQRNGHVYGPEYEGTNRWIDYDDCTHVLNWKGRKCIHCSAEKMDVVTNYIYGFTGKLILSDEEGEKA